jgi:hypothetical protein
MKKLARMMAALYPARWRRRYGDEFDALIEDSDSGWCAIVDLAKEAIKMQLRILSIGTLGVALFGVIGWLGGGPILLLVAALASMFCVMAGVAFFFNGEPRLAGRILYRWSICAAVYLAIVLAGAMVPREGRLKTGAPYCEDDWCMSVERVSQTHTPGGLS